MTVLLEYIDLLWDAGRPGRVGCLRSKLLHAKIGNIIKVSCEFLVRACIDK